MDIANCPWCDAEPVQENYAFPQRKLEYFVNCRHCGLRGPSRGSELDAARAWDQIARWKRAWVVE